MDAKTTDALEEALQRAYNDELHRRLEAFVEHILKTTEISQRRLEQLVGLSDGYLSRLRAQRGNPSAQVVSTLALLARDPARRVKELDQVWAWPPITAA